jgi:hypothetical protein
MNLLCSTTISICIVPYYNVIKTLNFKWKTKIEETRQNKGKT